MSNSRDGRDRRRAQEPVEIDRRRGDRRRWRRVPVQLWAEATDGEATYFNQAADLSPGGVFFAVPVPLPVGTVVGVDLELPGEPDPLAVRGVVVNAESGTGMGVRFIDLTEAQRGRIEATLTRVGD